MPDIASGELFSRRHTTSALLMILVVTTITVLGGQHTRSPKPLITSTPTDQVTHNIAIDDVKFNKPVTQ
jgi:hypothetical protein